MARPNRDIEPGIFHVTCHAVRDTELFRDNLDRTRFLNELATVTARTGWTCIAFCEMTTHFHLLVDVDAGVLPPAMHGLNFRYACGFNARHGTRGHVLERRYGAVRIMSDGHLLQAFRYVARNPVAARIVGKPEDWPWSSYAATGGLADPCPFVNASRVLEYFGASRETALAGLRAFVEEP